MFHRKKYYRFALFKHDFKASTTVFFVALPLCLGISLASGTPVYTGLIAGIVGGIIIPLISRSSLSVSGPAAGLTAICAAAIAESGISFLFIAVALSGLLQAMLGFLKLGGFTHFIPSSVIKGMLAAIGVMLISKQIPLLVGYDQPDFWQKHIINVLTTRHGFEGIENLSMRISTAALFIAALTLLFSYWWKIQVAPTLSGLPESFVTVVFGSLLAYLLPQVSALHLTPAHFVVIPSDIFDHWQASYMRAVFVNPAIWKYALIIAFVASLETLLSIEAIDKMAPLNRTTPHDRELVAQGVGNFVSGMLGGLPVTSVIVRSSANATAGARTRFSAFLHGVWLFMAVLFAAPIVGRIPYCVLAVILLRTGYHLMRPSMIQMIYKQGREQFLPFLVTVIAILFTDLLIGVVIGISYAIYFLIKHTYRAGYAIREETVGYRQKFIIDLALNVTFLNKKRFIALLESIPPNAIVEINGSKSIYIDHDVLEIFHDYRTKVRQKDIQLTLTGIPDVDTIGGY